jgi:hypothetical protein
MPSSSTSTASILLAFFFRIESISDFASDGSHQCVYD